MANSITPTLLGVGVILIAFAPTLCLCAENQGGLSPHFYDHSCPKLHQIVKSVVGKAVVKDPRMAASLLRLSFHDCFVQGCDASILLDSSGTIVSEKRSVPNRNSARGFEVIKEIKSAVEKACPGTVSCADILALASKDSTVMAGGPEWEVAFGRRDSKSASLSVSNNNIPAPNDTFPTILTKFKRHGLHLLDLVALSGSHTIGDARCTSFRQRLYNESSLNQAYASELKGRCPRSGGDQNLFFLDVETPFKFDNSYFKNLIASKGLLSSDEVLLTKSQQSAHLVNKYASDNDGFLKQFAESMVKLQTISPLTGKRGEIRKRCRQINNPHH